MSFLHIADLQRNFGGLRAVSDLTFSVAQGEIKAVIGPNGAGKTTLFNLIAGVTPPSSGQITLDGARIDQLKPYQRVERGIARTFQNLQIFKDMTVLENVMVGRHARTRCDVLHGLLRTRAALREEEAIRDSATQQLERLGLAHRADDRAGSLSFGECKVLEIARALAAEPKLLLLDEPTAGLPHAETERITDTIRALNAEGVTVLLVEHNMRMVMRLSHSILVLNYGRRIAEGPAEAVRRDPAVLEAYLGEEDDDA
ncbi:ABC transporter ATP-binding protein [Azospirillum rugosum]|uniref:Branched-chain amino acid transport system ATP-binding protein n=1 Tax=Azospirillum rugosum TaxID=416170 RepID=A0ABS4SK07_9PROT|nr:ABC transporter ATP-binding protein [Azospirillum rugosum]MBP2292907.1 branched-chain amino acid transport system ATP-binding protein [Azospirillum rugosum]MDQ0529341.1 branched-chain amino acid transport system ATP-binding protein [Azospirillum rugosum]